VFLAPFFWLQGASIVLGDESFSKKLRNGFSYGSKHYGTILLSIVVLCLVLFLFAQPIALVFSSGTSREPEFPDLLDKIASFTKNIARFYISDFMVPANIVRQLFYVIFMLFTIPLFIIAMSFHYLSVCELKESTSLKKQLETFGKRKRNQETQVDFE
jgi:Na+-driven multidrug efflux pump